MDSLFNLTGRRLFTPQLQSGVTINGNQPPPNTYQQVPLDQLMGRQPEADPAAVPAGGGSAAGFDPMHGSFGAKADLASVIENLSKMYSKKGGPGK